MEQFIQQLIPKDAKNEAKKYIHDREIPLLFECIVTGLLHHQPDNPAEFVQGCLDIVRDQPGLVLRWDIFIDWTPPAQGKSAADEDKDREPFLFEED